MFWFKSNSKKEHSIFFSPRRQRITAILIHEIVIILCLKPGVFGILGNKIDVALQFRPISIVKSQSIDKL